MTRLAALILAFSTLAGIGSAHASPTMNETGQQSDAEYSFTRIISLYAAHTQNLLLMGAGDRLVGVSRSAPEEALQNRTVLGSRDGAERFLALAPDLVLIRPMHERAHPGIWQTLREQGVTVLALQPNTLEEMYDYWKTLGRLSGRTQQALRMVEDFRSGLETMLNQAAQRPASERPVVFFESIHRYYRTFSDGSMPMLVLRAAGGVNALPEAPARHGSNIADCGKERLLGMGETIDAYVAQTGRMNSITRDTILNEPGYRAIRAVRTGRVFLVDEAEVSRPTPHLLDAARKLRSVLYNH